MLKMKVINHIKLAGKYFILSRSDQTLKAVPTQIQTLPLSLVQTKNRTQIQTVQTAHPQTVHLQTVQTVHLHPPHHVVTNQTMKLKLRKNPNERVKRKNIRLR